MRKYFKLAIAHPLFSSGFVMILGSNLVNGVNYIYHLFVGRMLGPIGYGELSALFSLIGLISIVPMSFGMVVTKFIASSKTDQEKSGLIDWFTKQVFRIAFGVCIVVVVCSFGIANFYAFFYVRCI